MERFTADLLFIVIVLLVAAIIGFLIGYFWKRKSSTKESITEDNTNTIATNNYLEERNTLAEENKKLKNELFELKTSQAKEKTLHAVKKTVSASVFNATNAKAALGKKIAENDFKIIEGIGPKIETLLKENNILTWRELANTESETIKKILLEQGGKKFSVHNPATWAEQAKMAFEGQWKELKSYQDYLDGGKHPGKK